ncbi:site-specific integrase [Epibacterium ulvae]|uniref:site-specific integrase n=1 Tax=Epibacterium ulvae TaxID=1156985 RepID=UPI0024925C4E|nr:site-specific integrase [Epibacterium ulvae]
MRIPQDIASLIESDPSIWKALALNPGARLNKWRDALTSMKRGQPLVAKKEFNQSLSARKLADAKAPYFALRNELEAVFETIRTAYSHEPIVATEQDLTAISEAYFTQIEVDAERNATELLGNPEAQEAALHNTLEDIAAIQNGHPSTLGAFQQRAKALLAEHSFALSSDTRSTLTSLLMRQALKSERRSLDRYRGDFKPDTTPSTTLVPRPMTHLADRFCLRDTFEQYLGDKRKLRLKSVEYLEAFGKIMKDFLGSDKPIRHITRQDARDFLHMLEHLPPNATKHPEFRHMTAPEASRANEAAGGQTIAPATLNKHFSNFRAFLQFCADEEFAEKNVALGLKAQSANPPNLKKRGPFTDAELSMIFGKTYRESAHVVRKHKNFDPKDFPMYARYWVPLIALFSGMRLQEICQLEVAAIGEQDGIPFLSTDWDIAEETDKLETGRKKHLKNDNSVRRIPIHPELVRLGLLEFHQRRKADGEHYLFPELPARRDGKVSRNVGDWFGKYIRSIGISDRSKVFHSFRYCFRGAMSYAEANPDIIRQVGGWSSKDTADHYASSLALKAAANEVAKVGYEGLDLSHLYVR